MTIRTEKGAEELLPAGVYEICGGTWVEETDSNQILINLYPESVDRLVSLLSTSGLTYEVLAIRQEEDRDYVAFIKKHFTPISVGNITVLPPWKKSRRTGPKIVIDPGMAFGTGRHESTRIMLRMMSQTKLKGMSVLDIGCGSGILAIYAHMMGASRVVAVDHDICAVEAVRKNASLNAADQMEVICTDIAGIRRQFDVVLANLDAETFSNHSSHIADLVKDEGLLLVSGIEAGQKNAALPFFSSLRRISQRRLNDWYGFTFQKKTGPFPANRPKGM